MSFLRISEAETKLSGMVYLYGSLAEVLSSCSGRFNTFSDGSRCFLEVETQEDCIEYVRTEIEDKIADVIAVSYKFNCFYNAVKPYGLTEDERLILISALISADMEEDKKYIKCKISSVSEYSVDGLFNFRLTKLKDKWKDVISYVPHTFDCEKLKDFLTFILEEKRGSKVFVQSGRVYDRYFRRVNRTSLTGANYGDARLVNEIILSGAGEVELLTAVEGNAEEYLKEYYGNRIIFGKTYYCN